MDEEWVSPEHALEDFRMKRQRVRVAKGKQKSVSERWSNTQLYEGMKIQKYTNQLTLDS